MYGGSSSGALLSDNSPSIRSQRTSPILAGRYRVDKLIARGGMATVYLAHQVGLNRPVALKVLTPPPNADEAAAFEHRFRLEAETLAQLDHPNIVVLHDFGETEDGRYFLAMEFIDGPRLSDLLKDGPMPVDRALPLLIQVCAGLRYAHRRGAVHRDLKPSNLLVKRVEDEGEEQIKIVDFGLVKVTSDDQSITRAGLILGSPHCMAPEQVKGLEVDHRTDIYAIGVLLFRTLTGQYPFHGPNSAATMIAHLNQPVPTFFSVAPELVAPEGLEEVVRRCLSKSPADRFGSMKEVIDSLAACMHIAPDLFRSMSQASSTLNANSMIGAPPRTKPPVRLPWVLLGLGVGAAMLVATLVVGVVVGGLWTTGNLAGLGSKDPLPPPVAAPLPVPVGLPTPTVAGLPVPNEAPGHPTADPGTDRAEAPPPRPAPAPVQRPAPAPATTRAPTPVAAAPAPVAPPPVAADPVPPPETNEDAPEGYMGMPDDLFD